MLDNIKINLSVSPDLESAAARESSDLKIERSVRGIKCYSMDTADEGLPSRSTIKFEPKTRPLDTDHDNNFWSHFGAQNSPVEMPKEGI